ncbi:hypothetical protein F0562_033637 [Nyssa sinensis]|uniref:Uncharacterized protein n=1 Tax=Nyssa sinensis TaxID=561372 RepID=A0A5J5AH54_9ASTE|nr:hypothetical protein F0562_033637 [Nyssa sinensis]
MADAPISVAAGEPNSQPPEPEIPAPQSNQADPSPPSSSSIPSTSVPVNPNPTPPPPIISPPQPPSIQPYAHSQNPAVPPTAPPSFRPLAPPVPIPTAPQFSPLPNSNLAELYFSEPECSAARCEFCSSHDSWRGERCWIYVGVAICSAWSASQSGHSALHPGAEWLPNHATTSSRDDSSSRVLIDYGGKVWRLHIAVL